MRALEVVNGRIWTLDESRPEVEALLSVDGRIVLTGSTATVRDSAQRFPDRETLDLAGQRAVPGLTDSHIHFVNYGLNLERVELTGVASLEGVRARVKAAALQTAPGEWVRGWGWDHSLWPDPRFPDRTALDDVTGDVPAALRRKDGHMIWLNAAALRAAGITCQTDDPPGGRIGRDARGEPDGLLFENAQDLIYRVMPEVTPAQAERGARRAQSELHRFGVTGVHVPEAAFAFRAFQSLDARDQLRLRVSMMLTHDGLDAAIETGLRSGFGGRFLRVGPMKMFVDGSLGSETAAMLAPFEGGENTGILTVPEPEIARSVERAAHAGIASAIHAIGDRANRVVLDAFERTRGVWEPLGLRQRIEHAQVLHRDDVPRFATLGVIPSVQPIHATQDMYLVEKLWGSRGRYAYAFHSLLATGARLAFGSDAPVETPDPMAGLYAAIARRRADGRPADGWYPEERLAVADAVEAYTAGAAFAAGLERRLGRLTPGLYADLTVLTEDILAGEPEAILGCRVAATIVGGEIVYAA
ncbi:MAG TPA: amidohydrolase [Chloroflexota bacterium]|nr:amidohydrolase [Chloroflexota bacterium]